MTLSDLGLDEIVALNVASLIEERKVSFAQVAEHLAVSRAHVYDMTRPRPGRAQREFRWKEIVKLASLFDVLVFDLVLPPEGVVLAGGEWLTGLYDGGVLASTPDDELGDIEIGALSSSDVSYALFGLPVVNSKLLEKLRTQLEQTKEERAQAVADELDSLAQEINAIEQQIRKLSEEIE